RPADAKPSAASERTAVFRAVKPGSASADSAEAADEERPADAKPSAASERTAVFRAVKPGSASADSAEAGDGKRPADAKPSDGSEPAASGKPAAQDPRAETKPSAGSERTAVFRTVKPGSAPADAEKSSAPAAQDPRAAEPSEDSERTAVFRAVKPGSAPADSGKAAPSAAGKPVEDEKPAARDPRAAGKPSEDSERTAVFRAVKPGSAPAGAGAKDAATSGAPADAGKPDAGKQEAAKPGQGKPDTGKPDASKPDAAKPDAAKPGQGKPDTGKPDAGKPGQGKPDAGKPDAGKPGAGQSPVAAPPKAAPAPEARVSKFVPLRADGEPAPAKPQPAAPKPDPAAAAPTVRRLDPSERTTQQPLPPRPPLDMLADLTNNPPPPPSPLRTVVRRVKIYAPIVVLLAVILAVVQLVRPLPAPKLVLTAKSQYTFPGGAPELPWPTEGQASMAAAGLGTIGSSGEQKPVPIASVTKSMTAYIIMRDHPFKKGEKGAMIDVDKTAETEGQKDKSDNESTLNTVKEGDKISEYDAIAALMIPSANNIARLLARWDSGSQEAFVKKMNDTAKQLGMTNTTYTDPSGLDASTVSTAEDQVKLGLKIVEIDAMVDITRKPSWTDQTGKNWPNWNRLVPYNESLGIKTGTTTKAGGNLLFAAYKKVGDTNQLIVGAVLGQHKPPIIDTVIAASKNLLVATQKSLEGAPVVKKGDVVGYVDDGVGGRTKVVATADVQAVGWSSLTVDIKLGDGGTKIPETAKAGTAVGVLTVGDGASQVKVPVALQSELTAPGIGSKLTRIG
ncbi:hypothetical protein AB0F18_20675, partial [Streptomyces sp. NPDC029216]|uniref:D-alanyl-D-alanine carboxypeptidase n=1 Tax=Streptomyces sp. NPDC029216 TaxID=3154701 RepID=UPI0033CD56E2